MFFKGHDVMTVENQDGIDFEIFNEAKEMMGKRFGDMVTYYLQDVSTYLKIIFEGLEEKDAEKIYLAAHSIKSCSHQIGMMKVSHLACDIEAMGRAISEKGDDGSSFLLLSNFYNELAHEFSTVEVFLKDFLSSF